MAEGLAAHGARVCIVSRSAEKAAAAAGQLNARGEGRCTSLSADVADERSVDLLRDSLAEQFAGQVNVVVNSAGINVRNPVERISLAEWESVQRVNSTGAFLVARGMYPLLRAAPSGRLIHVASIFGSVSFAHRSRYA